MTPKLDLTYLIDSSAGNMIRQARSQRGLPGWSLAKIALQHTAHHDLFHMHLSVKCLQRIHMQWKAEYLIIVLAREPNASHNATYRLSADFVQSCLDGQATQGRRSHGTQATIKAAHWCSGISNDHHLIHFNENEVSKEKFGNFKK
jgi:hypothetical protein